MRAITICFALLFSGATWAAVEAPQLEVLVVPTIQYAHHDIWTKTPNGRGPGNTAVRRVVRGQPVHILVFATNLPVGHDQNAAVNYRVSFIRPDETAGTAKEGLRLFPRGPVKEPRHVYKAHEFVVFVATQDDPLGKWGVVVEATDLVNGSTA